MKRTYALLFSLILVLSGCCKEESMSGLSDRVFNLAKKQLTLLAAGTPSDCMPVTYENGEMDYAGLPAWTSGFLPGSLWYVYEYTGDPEIRKLAVEQTLKLKDLPSMETDHDIGFQINSSFGNAYRLTGDESYVSVMKVAAAKLAGRFSPVTGTIKSWEHRPEWRYPVIIDNMMNLELLTATYHIAGGDSLRNVAVIHSNTTLKNHFRPDYSTYHVISYNPETGEVEARQTAQGYADESCWSRGESWALYGFTMMYRETGEKGYLEQARKVAEYQIAHLPEDGVPEWDYDAPGESLQRDCSAGSITASALLELSTFTTGDESSLYKATAEKILRTLASPEYLAAEGENGGFLLKHGVTDLHTGNGVDIPLTYADYYFLEALIRYKNLQ